MFDICMVKRNVVKEFYNEIAEDKHSFKYTIDAIAIWKMYLEINAPLKFLLDQQDIILQTLQIYCGQASTCEFNYENKKVIIRGENGIVKTI